MKPEEVEEIVCSYGAVLGAPQSFIGARDIKSLPYPKSEIRTALLSAFLLGLEEMREPLKVAYLALAEFQDLSERELLAFKAFFRPGQKPMTPEEVTPEMLEYTEDILAVTSRIGEETHALMQDLKKAGLVKEGV
jgi:hypothetical protein